MTSFATCLIAWQKQYGRHHLPWQQTQDPYRIWISEIMLQQTQVETVKAYYERFLKQFPNVKALATASFDEVVALWSGLGYYARARNLHKAANDIVTLHDGHFPKDPDQLERLAGIGRSTAAAIAAFAFGTRTTILDGNVKRILSRYFAISDEIDSAKTTRQLWQIAEQLLPDTNINAYIQGLMDLGSLVCKRNRPLCQICPVSNDCEANLAGNPQSYPVRKKAREKPEKAAIFLILYDEKKRILLKKRPPKGIWGGLWCFPDIGIDTKTSMNRMLEMASDALSVSTSQLTFLPAIKHVFTHFKLHIYPVTCQLNSAKYNLTDGRQHWFESTELNQLGFPKPVFDLLKQMCHN